MVGLVVVFLLLRPDSQFVSAGIGKVKTSSSREIKYLYHDCPSGFLNLSLDSFQFSRVDHHKQSASLNVCLFAKSTVKVSIIKTYEVRPIICKLLFRVGKYNESLKPKGG